MATEMRMPYPDGEVREVSVNISLVEGEIQVRPDPFYIEQHLDQEVRWTCKDGEFLVDFGKDSPFYESQFSQDSPVSGLARRSVRPNDGRIYKYTVWVGKKSLDPGGGVRK